jgi:hypothetical protein
MVSGSRADEDEAAFLDALGEVGILGQKAVARMDGIRAGDLRRADDHAEVEIAFRRLRRTDTDCLVGELHVLLVAVGLGVDSDRFEAELTAGAQHPQGDLAAIGDQDLFEHRGSTRDG